MTPQIWGWSQQNSFRPKVDKLYRSKVIRLHLVEKDTWHCIAYLADIDLTKLSGRVRSKLCKKRNWKTIGSGLAIHGKCLFCWGRQSHVALFFRWSANDFLVFYYIRCTISTVTRKLLKLRVYGETQLTHYVIGSIQSFAPSSTVLQIFNDNLGCPSCLPYYWEWRLNFDQSKVLPRFSIIFKQSLRLVSVIVRSQFQCQDKAPNSKLQIGGYSRVRQPNPVPVKSQPTTSQ